MQDAAFVAVKTGRRASGPKRLIAALFLSTATVSAPFFTPALAQEYSFDQITVEGNEQSDVQTILGLAGIARGAVLTAAQVNDVYQGLMNSGLFEEVEIIPEGDRLVIKVKEYPIVNFINFEGNKRIKTEDLEPLISSQVRRVYSPATAEADAANIAEAYRARGRIAATVTPRIIRRDAGRVDLVFEITEGRVTEIERLSFVGNRAFSDRRLRQVLETKQAGFLRQLIQRDTYVAERLEVDKDLLRQFYLSRGYADVRITDASGEIARERDAVFVTFNVQEGQQFRFGKITTVSEVEGIDAAEFEGLTRTRTGAVYTPTAVDATIERMENLALRKGLTFVRVDPRVTKNDADGTLDIEFAIVRGERIFVERIDIEGNTTTLDAVIRRQFRTAEGDPFNPRELRQAAEKIKALGFFKSDTVSVAQSQGSAADQVIVDVNVEEQPTGSLTLGASYAADDGVGFNIGFSETNFLGRGQAFSFSLAQATDSKDYGISFTEPAFLGRDVALSFSIFSNETTNKNSNYSTSATGFNTSLKFPLGELSNLSVKYSAVERNVSNYTGVGSATLAAETARGKELTSLVGYVYEYDTRVAGLSSDRGFVFRFGQDFAGLGGDATYVRTDLSVMGERKVLNEDVTLRAIFKAGNITSTGGYITRVNERYFGGIRGFEGNGVGPRVGMAAANNAFGGNNYFVATAESDFPIGLPEEYGITGSLFVDAGSVWGMDAIDTVPVTTDDSMHIRAAAGFAIVWTSPIGPLRLNFTRPIKKEAYDKPRNFELSISTKF